MAALCVCGTDLGRVNVGHCSICGWAGCSALCNNQHWWAVHKPHKLNPISLTYCLGCYKRIVEKHFKCAYCGARFCCKEHRLRHQHQFHRREEPACLEPQLEAQL